MFYFRDISQNHHPYRELTVSMIAAHEAPLWNPARGAGQPLLANPNALVLHPTTLLFLVLPVASAMKMSVILQILLAGIATWLLLRDAGVSRAGSLLGAGVFAFSGYMISLGNLLNLLDSAAFMPLTLWLAARAVKLRFAPWGSLAALSLAVQVAAGEPAILLCTGLGFVALHWSFPAVSGQVARPAGTRVAVVIGLVLLAGTLAMVQLLPTLELLGQSERGAGFDRDEAMKWSLPPAALVESVVPGWYGDPTRADTTKFRGGSVFDAGLPFILSIYLGPAALLLAGLGIAGALRCKGARRTETIALSSIALGGVLLSLGRFFPLYPALLAMAPPMQSVRYPVKYFVLVAWALAILSARGYDTCLAWSEAAGDRPRKKIAGDSLRSDGGCRAGRRDRHAGDRRRHETGSFDREDHMYHRHCECPDPDEVFTDQSVRAGLAPAPRPRDRGESHQSGGTGIVLLGAAGAGAGAGCGRQRRTACRPAAAQGICLPDANRRRSAARLAGRRVPLGPDDAA